MKSKLSLSIITPEKAVFADKEVSFVCLPAFEGELGVLPGHISTVVQLKEGLLHYKSGREHGEFSVMSGFAEINKNHVLVLAEAAELAKEIDEERARQAYRKAKDALNVKGDAIELDSALSALKRAAVRLKIAEYRRKKGVRS
ncbi:MAG TPA: ATP synthase F1 subunit epsilon [Elusimicrobia bacterium]|nr:ATP synthase F1 subunit epsilon [Elusimicrobiota bacterium]